MKLDTPEASAKAQPEDEFLALSLENAGVLTST